VTIEGGATVGISLGERAGSEGVPSDVVVTLVGPLEPTSITAASKEEAKKKRKKRDSKAI
jgi:hypothetical protein